MTEVETVGGLPPIPMLVRDGLARVTSREVSEIFGKLHQHVLEKVRLLECSEDFRQSNFRQSSYLNAQNKPQPMVEMTRDGFTFLAMGFTGPRAAQFKEAFITAFNTMEAQLRGGAELPYIQRQIDLLVTRQEQVDHKINAILDLVDVTKRYVALLEGNQKPPRRTRPHNPMTVSNVLAGRELFAQGLSVRDVSHHLGIALGSAHNILRGNLTAKLKAELVAAGEAPEVPA